jgi:hypothetical protein
MLGIDGAPSLAFLATHQSFQLQCTMGITLCYFEILITMLFSKGHWYWEKVVCVKGEM